MSWFGCAFGNVFLLRRVLSHLDNLDHLARVDFLGCLDNVDHLDDLDHPCVALFSRWLESILLNLRASLASYLRKFTRHLDSFWFRGN